MRPTPPLPLLLLLACASTPPAGAPPASSSSTAPTPRALPPVPREVHLADVRQLTFGGENAEAYWAFQGGQLIFQARAPDEGCDRIWRMDLRGEAPQKLPVSSGEGATTCSYFLPGDEEVIYASTHLGGRECPPRPDMRQGYVWALYDSYDIFRASADGSNVRRLTDTPGYDAEATVCGKDGSIVFTSVRDGDIELYRMDADGRNVRRLTHTPGYDGGAFFSRDCSKLVWRASRPTGAALEEYRALLAQGLVRPSKLELYVANADGSEPVQVTYLDAASFAPFFFPDGKRILFSSNVGDPRGREFNLWAVNVDGTGLTQVTHAPGFDGFPMFSPDGTQLVFGSNRGTPPGAHDTNLFLARWVEAPPARAAAGEEEPLARLSRDVTWLASPEREGRGVGTQGLSAAGEQVEARFRQLGLSPAGDAGSFRQAFPVVTGVEQGSGTRLTLTGRPVEGGVSPVGFSSSAEVKGALVLAGYGIVAPEAGRDDYQGLDVKGRLVVVRRFTPEEGAFADAALQRRYGDLRHKAFEARQRGALGLLVVDWPEGVPADRLPAEAPAPSLRPEGTGGDAGLPVAVVSRAALAPHMPALQKKGGRVAAELVVSLSQRTTQAFNVVGRLSAGAPEGKRLPGVVVVGAHYDHLGMGGAGSLAPGVSAPHLGADDNASGVAALLEVARALSARREALSRDVLFVAFSAEEMGVLGSTYFTRTARPGEVVGMLNLDMVGRLRANRLEVLGADSAAEWAELVGPACQSARVECSTSGDGYGPSDHMPFFAAGIPVLHFFTGAHGDYHKPSDAPATLNYAGLSRVAQVVEAVATGLSVRPQHLTFRNAPAPLPLGDRRSFGASLGTVPDYGGPPPGVKGVLLAGVRPGGAAEVAGMRRGDVLLRLGEYGVGSVEDLMFALTHLKPGQTVPAVVLREGSQVTFTATLQEARQH